MPEPMPGLTDRLRSARADLLNEIKVPELGAVRSRAHRIRRRRRGLQATAGALALVAVVGAGVAVTRNGPWSRPAPIASAGPTASPAAAPAWRGGGLTINGLDGPHLDLPGVLVDVQFADSNRAYALALDCPEGGGACGTALASSTDGGHSWQEWTIPVTQAAADQIPRLVTVGTSGVALLDGNGVGFYSPADGPQWTQLSEPTTVIDRLSAADRLTVSERGQPQQCRDLTLRVLRPDGTSANLRNHPSGLQVCGVAPARAADGSLWAAGRTDAGPAVAVSRDDGTNWTVTTLPVGGGWAQVATVGSQVYATVVSPRSGTVSTLTIEGVLRATAADADPDFRPYAGKIGTVDGEVVPVMDGRLVAAGPNWYVSQEGATMQGAGGTLPWVGRILRSPGGWIAYNLFEAGWVATSLDGITWQKINLR